MVKDIWNILKQKEIKVENNGFIEISLKEPPEGSEKLISISKGWFNYKGKKLYKSNILFSIKKRDEIIKILENIENED